jgi:hypothetical protein
LWGGRPRLPLLYYGLVKYIFLEILLERFMILNVKKSLYITCVVALSYLLTSCSSSYRSVRIKDVRKPETVTLNKAFSQGHIYSLSIRGTGKLDGTANISLLIEGKVYRTQKLNNSINFTWNNDWYSDKAVIRYSPINVKYGDFIINYRF